MNSTNEDGSRPLSSPDPPGPTLPGRYASITLVDGDVVIYDRENQEAWIQSDVAKTAPV